MSYNSPPGGYPPQPHQPPYPNNAQAGQVGFSMPQPYPPPSAGYPPVMQQPYPQPAGGAPPMQQASGWMSIPQGPPNCPTGLEYLTMVDQLLVHQKVELLEALVGFETNNKFTIKNTLGQKIYYAVEEASLCARLCCGPIRPYHLKILDNYRNEVIHIYRQFRCAILPCCLEKMEVFSPPGHLIGTIEQEFTFCKPHFLILNECRQVVLRIEGPLCRSRCMGDVKFRVLSGDGKVKLGKISKQWAGLARELFTDADYFGISFPMDLDVRMKAVLLGACFLIDSMYFERSGDSL